MRKNVQTNPEKSQKLTQQYKRRPKPWCMQYSQDPKDHLAAEKQIAAAREDEIAMAAIRRQGYH